MLTPQTSPNLSVGYTMIATSKRPSILIVDDEWNKQNRGGTLKRDRPHARTDNLFAEKD